MEQFDSAPQHQPSLVDFLAKPENTARFDSFCKFYQEYCYPIEEPTHAVDDKLHDFSHLLACGMTADLQTIMLRSTDGPDVHYWLLSHDFTNGAIKEYQVSSIPEFYQDDRRFQFGATSLIMNICATNQASGHMIDLELTSQSCTVTESDKNPQEIVDIYMLPHQVRHLRTGDM